MSGEMIGRIVGNYRIVEEIGRGGMGVVYGAIHDVIGRKVAIKVLLPAFARDPEITERFLNEARAAALIGHRNIVDVLDMGRAADGSIFLVMERLAGESLAARLRRTRGMDLGTAVRILRMVTSALDAAHAKGIVHRDLKPDNVFLTPDTEVLGGERAKLLDFGIAKLTGGHAGSRTQTGTLMGTPLYMSPEQCHGARDVDARSDIYALGCILFEMLCGRPPFPGEGLGQIIAAHLHAAPPDPRTLEPGLPVGLTGLVARALAKDPRARFQSVGELMRALEIAAAAGNSILCAATAASPQIAPPASLTPSLMTVPPVVVTSAGPAPHRGRDRGRMLMSVAGIASLVAAAVLTGRMTAQTPGATGSDAMVAHSASARPIEIRMDASVIDNANAETAPVVVAPAQEPSTVPPRREQARTTRTARPPVQPAAPTSDEPGAVTFTWALRRGGSPESCKDAGTPDLVVLSKRVVGKPRTGVDVYDCTDGHFTLELPPGRYELIIAIGDQKTGTTVRTIRRTVTVEPGRSQSSHVVFEL